MRPILTREFSFQLVLGFCTLSLSQYWKYNVPTRCSRFFTCEVYHGVQVDMLEDENLGVMSSPHMSSRNHSPIFSSRRILSFSVIWLCSQMYWYGIAAAAAAARRCFSKRPGFYPHRESNSFPMHAWRFIFVSTLFESCEPYSWHSTVGCEDSQHRLSQLSSFSRNDEP